MLHCLSVNGLLCAIFLYKLLREKNLFSFSSRWHFPSFHRSAKPLLSFFSSPTSSCCLIKFSSGTLFKLAITASFSATYTQTANLFHFHSNFQMNFTGMKWRGPFTSPLHHLSVSESTSESFIGMIQWQ